MRAPGIPTLDQLQVFLTVAESGSFAAAGRRLGRATSAISYTIANLEGQLGLPLFDRKLTRKPELTEAGRAVLSQACAVTRGIDTLRAKVKGLMQGLEAEISLAVDVMLPTDRLVDALQGFQAHFPTVTLRLHVEALGAVIQRVLDGTASIAVSSPIHAKTEGIEQIQIGGVLLIPVAAPLHPLACGPEWRPGMARSHVQLVLSDRSSLTKDREFGVLGDWTWRLADLGSKHALLLAGVGWGGMPEPMVRDDIEAGRLVRLPLPDWPSFQYPFSAIHRTDSPPGPAAQWLIDRFAGQADGAVP